MCWTATTRATAFAPTWVSRRRNQGIHRISVPYEPPMHPELELHTDQLSVKDCVSAILAKLKTMLRKNHP
jgi:adenylylsulfate kinase-like enzyme